MHGASYVREETRALGVIHDRLLGKAKVEADSRGKAVADAVVNGPVFEDVHGAPFAFK